MRLFILLALIGLLHSPILAQTDFNALEQSFDELLKRKELDSALSVATRVTTLAYEEHGDMSAWYEWGLLHELAMNDILGDVHQKSARYQPAEVHYLASLAVWRKGLDLNDPYYPECLDKLGALYWRIGRYRDAEPPYLEAMGIRDRTVGTADSSYATSLSNLGLLYQSMDDLDRAEEYHNRALAIRKNTIGRFHPDFAITLNNLGALYREKGDLDRAEGFYTEALTIRRTLFGDVHGVYAESLNNMAALYEERGDYRTAEQYLQRAAVIRERVLGKTHPDYALTLNNLGVLAYTMGDLPAALRYHQLASEAFKASYGPDSPVYATSLNNLGAVFTEMRDYLSAIEHFNGALTIYLARPGEEPLSLMRCLNSIGRVSTEIEQYRTAEEYYKRALQLCSTLLGEEHAQYATILNNLGALYYTMGNYEAAELHSRQALVITAKHGTDHPDYALRQTDLATLLERTGRYEEALVMYKESYERIARRVASEFEWLSDEQREQYWGGIKTQFEYLSTFSSRVHDRLPEAVGLSYDSAILTKGRLLESRLEKRGVYGPAGILELQGQLRKCRQRIAKHESDGSTDNATMNKLRNTADSLDKQLALRWPDYEAQRYNMSITWQQVRTELGPDEAAIEFVRYVDMQDTTIKYHALLLRPQDPHPVLVPLCSESGLLTIRPQAGFHDYYPLVWEPLQPFLTQTKTIYYSPVGLLNSVPFHALVMTQDPTSAQAPATDPTVHTPAETMPVPWPSSGVSNATYLMDRFTLHQLTSTRYLALGLKTKTGEKLGSTAVLVGDVSYDDSIIGGEGPDSGKWKPLPGSAREVAEVSATLGKARWKVSLLSKEKATEENLLALSGEHAPDVLHIATHGFAFGQKALLASGITRSSNGSAELRTRIDPMLRCGLVLSGGNRWWAQVDTLLTEASRENGILTASEVSELDLRRTQLVVLSACETGLGDVKGSEGTYGITRGFKLAGVSLMIVSLWPVPDKETSELMTAFYAELAESKDANTAFANSQRKMRNKYPDRPKEWAGFVLVH